MKPRGHSHVRKNEPCYPKNSSFLGQNIIVSQSLNLILKLNSVWSSRLFLLFRFNDNKVSVKFKCLRAFRKSGQINIFENLSKEPSQFYQKQIFQGILEFESRPSLDMNKAIKQESNSFGAIV